MAIVTTDNKYYAEIAAAIRAVNGLTDLYTPAQMAEAILALGGSGGLPDGYTLLEYIQSSGTQYIDTGFKANQDTRVLAEVSGFETTDLSTSVYGSRTSAGASDCYMLLVNASGVYRSDYAASVITFDSSQSFGEKITIDQNKNVVTLGEETVTHTATTFTCSYNLFVCGTNTGGSLSHGLKGNLYSCQIYDNGTLVRDFVPCIDPNGEVGLYDLATKAFYGNAGTGTFTAGYILPDGYTQLEYIQSSGTQYIDTGFMPNQNTRVVIDVQATNTTDGVFFGGRDSTACTFTFFMLSGQYRTDFGNASITYISLDPTVRRIIDKNKNITTVEGTEYTNTSSTFATSTTMTLLAVNTAGTVSYKISARLYSCQIYDNGILVRDYVPCINPSGVYGLYDLANETFYSNAGSGSFTGA